MFRMSPPSTYLYKYKHSSCTLRYDSNVNYLEFRKVFVIFVFLTTKIWCPDYCKNFSSRSFHLKSVNLKKKQFFLCVLIEHCNRQTNNFNSLVFKELKLLIW